MSRCQLDKFTNIYAFRSTFMPVNIMCQFWLKPIVIVQNYILQRTKRQKYSDYCNLLDQYDKN